MDFDPKTIYPDGEPWVVFACPVSGATRKDGKFEISDKPALLQVNIYNDADLESMVPAMRDAISEKWSAG